MEERPRGYYKAQDLSDEIRRIVKEREKAEALRLLKSYRKKQREAALKAAKELENERESLRDANVKSLYKAENLRKSEGMKGLGSGQLELFKTVSDSLREKDRQKGERLIRAIKNHAAKADAELLKDYRESREILGNSFNAKLAERLSNEAKRVGASFKEPKPVKSAARSRAGGTYSASGGSYVKTGAALTSLLMKSDAKKRGGAKGGNVNYRLSYHVK